MNNPNPWEEESSIGGDELLWWNSDCLWLIEMEKGGSEAIRVAIPVFLSVFNEWRGYPVECIYPSHISSVDSLDSLHRIPNGMFCSSHSYLLFTSWITPMELLPCIPRGLLLHLLSPNDLDCNPFSCPIVHMILYTPKCSLLFCIPIPIWWLCHSRS